MDEPVPAAAAAADQPPVPDQPDPRDAEIARLRGQVADLTKAREPEAGEVAIKVEKPHAEFHFGNVHLGREFTAVPAHMAAAIHSAAHEAGVLLTQKEN